MNNAAWIATSLHDRGPSTGLAQVFLCHILPPTVWVKTYPSIILG